LRNDADHEGLPAVVEVGRLVASGNEDLDGFVNGFGPADVQLGLGYPQVEVRVWRSYSVLTLALPDHPPDAPPAVVLPIAAALKAELDAVDLRRHGNHPVASRRADRVKVLDFDAVSSNSDHFANSESVMDDSNKLSNVAHGSGLPNLGRACG
jgi:hypothetical protein